MASQGFIIAQQKTSGRLCNGDRITDHRHGDCVIVSIPDLYSIIVRREKDGQYLNISGLYWGSDVRLERAQ